VKIWDVYRILSKLEQSENSSALIIAMYFQSSDIGCAESCRGHFCFDFKILAVKHIVRSLHVLAVEFILSSGVPLHMLQNGTNQK
jgi:hypothetical protein